MNAIEEQRLLGPVMPLVLAGLSEFILFSGGSTVIFLTLWFVGFLWLFVSFASAKRLGTSKGLLLLSLLLYLFPAAVIIIGGLFVSH